MKDKIKRNVPSNSKLDSICENGFCNVLLEHGVFDTSKCKKLVFEHELIFSSSKLNFEDCKIKTDSKLNVDFFKFMLKDYFDYEICKFLEYGFPIGFPRTVESLTLLQEFKDPKEMLKVKNHRGAVDFPKDIDKYLIKELKKGAVVGPFHENPFDHGIIISPLNTVPKKDSLERRVILDLSAAGGMAVNVFISKDEYLGEPMTLTYPRVDDLVNLIKEKGRGSLLFKRDLSRAYRQIPIDMGDASLVGYAWNGHIFF